MEQTRWNDILRIATTQHGHITRPQLLDLGMATETVSRWSRSSRLIAVGHQTFRMPGLPPSRRADVAAACLDTGGRASHHTATWMNGLTPWRLPIDVIVHEDDIRGHAGLRRLGLGPVRVHETSSLPAADRFAIDGIPTVSVARALLGLAAQVPSEVSQSDLVEVISNAVDRRLASDPWLWWLLMQRRCRGRNGVTAMAEALAQRADLGPTESWLERHFLAVLDAHGVPRPRTQQVVKQAGRFVARVDFLYDAPMVSDEIVVEVLGYAHHRTPVQLKADLARANAITLTGRRILQFTTPHLVETPADVAATVLRVLESRQGQRPAA